MKTKEKINIITDYLEKMYPVAKCSLEYKHDFELLFATRLSAQCTDARVNIVTKELFKKYKTLKDYALADLRELEKIIFSTGFYRAKAKNIIDAANMILHELNGTIPDTIEELVKIPGVGRKTANLIVGDIFGKASVVADTHCIRISNRLGLCQNKDPYKVEIALKDILPPEKSSDFCHRLVLFGREVCTARNPRCTACGLCGVCVYYKETIKKA